MTALFSSGADGAGGRDPLAPLAMCRQLRPLLAPGLLERAMHSAEHVALCQLALAGAAPTPLVAVLAQDGYAGVVVEFEGETGHGGGGEADDADDAEALRGALEEVIPTRIVGNCARAVVLVLPSEVLQVSESEFDDDGADWVHLVGVDAEGRVLTSSGLVVRDTDHMSRACEFGTYTGPELARAQTVWLEALRWTLCNRSPN
jgi:hypothetical protein